MTQQLLPALRAAASKDDPARIINIGSINGMPHEAEMAAGFPCSRLGNAEDAAGTAIYLCSRASAWVTGHTLVLDGGAVANAG